MVDGVARSPTKRAEFAMYPATPQRVLTELGRIDDEKLFWRATVWYAQACQERRGTAGYAAEVIRGFRLRRT